jgi:RNA polymerase sigma factor (sigma-70 family)
MNSILEETQPLVRSIVLADYRDNRIEADDMIQEILIHLMQKLPRFSSDRGTLHNYASTLIRNKAIDILRRVQRGVPTISLEDELTGIESVSLQANDPMIKRWKMLAVWLYMRFKELTQSEAIEIANRVLYGLVDGKSKKALLAALRDSLESDYLSQANITTIYQSAVWFLRILDFKEREEHLPVKSDISYTLYPELSYTVGESMAQDLQWLFSGMAIVFKR